MPTWLRSLVNAFLGRVPGKTSRLDTATRMMIDADSVSIVNCLANPDHR